MEPARKIQFDEEIERESYSFPEEFIYDARKQKKQPENVIVEPSIEQEETQNAKQLKLGSVLMTIFVFAAICAMFSFLIARNLIICNNNVTINELKEEISELSDDTEYLSVQAKLADNLENVKKVASEQLHMGYPTSDQIVYLNID